jgi:2-iminobutanoate/2-iminopropanoate deaminase
MSSGQFNRQAVSTDKAPAAIGPYSQAVRSGSLLFVSGQIALDPSSGELANRDVTSETRQVLQNLGAILTAAGTSFDRVVKTTVYLLDMSDFAAMNEVYLTAFRAPAPARATVAVAGLPRGARVEIELIAEL